MPIIVIKSPTNSVCKFKEKAQGNIWRDSCLLVDCVVNLTRWPSSVKFISFFRYSPNYPLAVLKHVVQLFVQWMVLRCNKRRIKDSLPMRPYGLTMHRIEGIHENIWTHGGGGCQCVKLKHPVKVNLFYYRQSILERIFE